MQSEGVGSSCARVLDQVERAVVGKRDVLQLVLLGLLADGNVLIEDFPGLRKHSLLAPSRRRRVSASPASSSRRT